MVYFNTQKVGGLVDMLTHLPQAHSAVVLQRKGEALFSVTFDVMRYIFSKNFIQIHQVVQKI